MTPQQAVMVKTSFWTALAQRDRLERGFHAELFARDPGLWRLFSQDPALRGARLFQSLAWIVGAIDRLHPILPVLEWLALRSAARGLHEHHHVVAVDAWLAALETLLGSDFTPMHRQAWWLACRAVIDVMVAAVESEPLAA